MKLKVFQNMGKHAFYVLLLSVLAAIWWVAMWGLIDDAIETVQDKYKISKRAICFALIGCIILIIFIHPNLLSKI